YTTEANASRRAAYLVAASDLLLVHLNDMVTEWNPGTSGNYRATFLSLDPDQALRNMLTAIGTLAKSELAVERMFVAVNNQNQEDEHSCFSDNTHRDIITNAQGVANVYRGSYTRTNGSTVSGASIADLVEEVDETAANDTEALLSAALQSVNAIPVPFDRAIIDSQQDVLDSVDALQSLGDSFVVAATALGISINTDLPE
ncbi:MAG: imelysin family protein, partial [Bacteroidota bacterium]